MTQQAGNSHLFRATALEQLSSPEQMDELPLITGFHYWMALVALFLLLGGAGIWAFQSTLVSTVSGHGVLSISEHTVEVVAYVPSAQAGHIADGMEVRVLPLSMKLDQYGFIRGKVVEVAPGSTIPADLVNIIASGPERSLTRIRVALESDPRSPSGLNWSSSRGPSFSIAPGTVCATEIVLARQRPISLVLPYLKRTLEGR